MVFLLIPKSEKKQAKIKHKIVQTGFYWTNKSETCFAEKLLKWEKGIYKYMKQKRNKSKLKTNIKT